jgi:hypothetical protein
MEISWSPFSCTSPTSNSLIKTSNVVLGVVWVMDDRMGSACPCVSGSVENGTKVVDAGVPCCGEPVMHPAAKINAKAMTMIAICFIVSVRVLGYWSSKRFLQGTGGNGQSRR